MEAWREVWRRGVAPQLSTAGLMALRLALETDDERLVQGVTTITSPLLTCMAKCEPEGACVIGLAGWLGDGMATVSDVEEWFARVWLAVADAFGSCNACRRFLDWADEVPRGEMRQLLLPEVVLALKGREVSVARIVALENKVDAILRPEK